MSRTSIDLRLAFFADFHANKEEDIDRALTMIDELRTGIRRSLSMCLPQGS